MILPAYKTVIPYILNDKSTFIGLQPRTSQDNLISTIFPDLSLDLATIFAYEE